MEKGILNNQFFQRIGIFLLLAFSLLFFSTCGKVGEDDPAFSLRSRKARVEGDWEFVRYSSSELSQSQREHNVFITNRFDLVLADIFNFTFDENSGEVMLNRIQFRSDKTFSWELQFKGTITTTTGEKIREKFIQAYVGTWDFLKGEKQSIKLDFETFNC